MADNVLFWGQLDPLHRASSVSVEEAVDYYRKSFKTLCKSSVVDTENDSKSLKFSQSAATSLNDVLRVLMQATKEQIGTRLPQRIFEPPTKSLPKKYFPKTIAEETPEYFLKKHKRITSISKAQSTYFCDRTPMKQPVAIDKRHWNNLQAKESDILQRRGKHLMAILEDQQLLEIEREMKLNQAVKYDDAMRMKCIADIAKERYEAADRIMRILDDYGIVPSSIAIEYFQLTLPIKTSSKSHN
ncbi:hypothetical protein THRCLA_07713 [Thraustotheca clavata]|uniref:Uncharacterized protein n=1 Tax=Thraustotheca clavata TaxID=74557 RepID=A0A1V9ZC91_9STRA|nr:hypothetical protein THRCLA_07713 [Thraustotheca clavata]